MENLNNSLIDSNYPPNLINGDNGKFNKKASLFFIESNSKNLSNLSQHAYEKMLNQNPLFANRSLKEIIQFCTYLMDIKLTTLPGSSKIPDLDVVIANVSNRLIQKLPELKNEFTITNLAALKLVFINCKEKAVLRSAINNIMNKTIKELDKYQGALVDEQLSNAFELANPTITQKIKQTPYRKYITLTIQQYIDKVDLFGLLTFVNGEIDQLLKVMTKKDSTTPELNTSFQEELFPVNSYEIANRILTHITASVSKNFKSYKLNISSQIFVEQFIATLLKVGFLTAETSLNLSDMLANGDLHLAEKEFELFLRVLPKQVNKNVVKNLIYYASGQDGNEFSLIKEALKAIKIRDTQIRLIRYIVEEIYSYQASNDGKAIVYINDTWISVNEKRMQKLIEYTNYLVFNSKCEPPETIRKIGEPFRLNPKFPYDHFFHPLIFIHLVTKAQPEFAKRLLLKVLTYDNIIYWAYQANFQDLPEWLDPLAEYLRQDQVLITPDALKIILPELKLLYDEGENKELLPKFTQSHSAYLKFIHGTPEYSWAKEFYKD